MEILGLLSEAEVPVKELAKRADIHKCQLHQYLRGERMPSKWVGSKIAKALGIPEAEFFDHVPPGKRGRQYTSKDSVRLRYGAVENIPSFMTPRP